VTKVFVSPGDQGACGFYRLIWPARAVAATGEMRVEIADDRYIGWRMDDFINYLTPADANVVVVQRPCNPTTVAAVTRLRDKGIAVVVDMDDDLGSVHVDNAAYMWASEYHRYAVDACAKATMVTVSTPALAEVYAPHGRVRVVPNCVPSSYLNYPHRDTALVGWGGALRSHPNDLNVLGDSILKLMCAGMEFKIVGPGGGVGRVLGLPRDPNATDGVPLTYWPRELSKLGIGIAPLAPTKFNDSKSWLRVLEYSSLGDAGLHRVPFLWRRPLGLYSRGMGAGDLAHGRGQPPPRCPRRRRPSDSG
jgi:hypothetical protein